MKVARTIAAIAALFLAVAFAHDANAQLYQPGLPTASHEPAGHSIVGKWQALALSQNNGKDGWTSQSMKDDRLAAYNDVLSRCNLIQERMRLPKDCVAFASQQWVASYYCREGKTASFGEGPDAAAAMNDALKKAEGGRYCEFKAVRGPAHGMEAMTKSWKATCACGDRTIPMEAQGHPKADSAVLAVNNAYIECAERGRFYVASLSITQ